MQEDQDKTTRDAGFMRTKIQKISVIAALIVANTYVSAQSFSNTIFLVIVIQIAVGFIIYSIQLLLVALILLVPIQLLLV